MVKTYIKKDLSDYVTEISMDGYSSTRSSMIESSLPDNAYVLSKQSGGYQGEIAIIVMLDEYYWYIHTAYGSCSHCDGFIGCEVEETKRLLRDAYCFETVDDMRDYIENEQRFGWNGDSIRKWSLEVCDNINEVLSEMLLFGEIKGVVCPDTLS